MDRLRPSVRVHPGGLYQPANRLTLAIVVMARLVRATCRGTVLVQVARTSRAMTDLKSRTSIFRPIGIKGPEHGEHCARQSVKTL